MSHQDAFLKAGGVEALESLLCADWGETRSTAGVQAAAARALADAMTSNKAAKDAFSRQGEFRPSTHARLPSRAETSLVIDERALLDARYEKALTKGF